MTAAVSSIRDMEENDLAWIMEIERASFPSPWAEEMFRRQLLLDDVAVNLVAAEGDRIVGYAISWIAYDEVHVLSIAVAPAERRAGKGSALLAELIRRAAARGGKRVILEVRRGNAAARTFYEKRGFAVIGIRKKYYVDTGEDAVVMELDIEG